jgi:transposase/CRISPR-associated protein Csx1
MAQAATGMKNSKVRKFFNWINKSLGHVKAIIALARKIATIILHFILEDSDLSLIFLSRFRFYFSLF